MRLKKGLRLLLLNVAAIGGSIFLNSYGLSPERIPPHDLCSTRKLIVIIFDFKSLFCPLCLEALVDFCNTLHSYGQDIFTLGVAVRDSDSNDSNDKSIKIAEKQIKGFVFANKIKFPILLDKYRVFAGLNPDGTTVILFDRARKMLKKYTLPLTSEQVNEIFSF
ncbi:MAG: hypothetical protein ACETWK_02045 [Candidatus Aminicenantaceae bacterium]